MTEEHEVGGPSSSSLVEGEENNAIKINLHIPGLDFETGGEGEGSTSIEEHMDVDNDNIIIKKELEDGGPCSSAPRPAPNNNPVLPKIPFSFPGQTFDSRCQKLILNVWDFFKRLKKNPDILEEIKTPQERAAACLHISAATIGKIGKNFRRTGKLETPGNQRKRQKPVVDSVTKEDERTIEQIMAEMKRNKVTLTIPGVLAEAKARINFQGGQTSFRRVLSRMGYRNLSQKQTTKKMDGTPGTASIIVQTPSQQGTHSGQQTLFTTIPAAKIIKKEPLQSGQGTLIPIITSGGSHQGGNAGQMATIVIPASAATSSSSSGIVTTASGISSTAQTVHTANIIQIAGGQILSTGEGGSGTTALLIPQGDNTFRPVQVIFSTTNLT